MNHAPPIPTLDARLINAGPEQRREFVHEFRCAFVEAGFAILRHHDVDPALRHSVFAASREFHRQPGAYKNTLSLDSNHRGFIAIDSSTDTTSTLATVTRPNQSESFMVMGEDPPDSPAVQRGDYLAGSNQWPNRVPGFKSAVLAWQDAMTDLARSLLGIAAEAMGVPATAFHQDFNPPTIWLRLLRYPPRPENAPEDLYGSAPHHDFGALTLLVQDAPGLEILHPDAGWITAPCESRDVSGDIIINTGSMMRLYSGGALRATPHRVINTTGDDRYSCAFFFDPNVNATVKPVNSTLYEGNPKQYAPVCFGDFVRQQLTRSYVQHASNATK